MSEILLQHLQGFFKFLINCPTPSKYSEQHPNPLSNIACFKLSKSLPNIATSSRLFQKKLEEAYTRKTFTSRSWSWEICRYWFTVDAGVNDVTREASGRVGNGGVGRVGKPELGNRRPISYSNEDVCCYCYFLFVFTFFHRFELNKGTYGQTCLLMYV